MPSDHLRFPGPVQRLALARQKFRCGSCGTIIWAPGRTGQTEHEFGEGAEGHHVVPHILGGPITIDNCIVLCRSCHLNAHQGGRWGDVTIYADLARLPMPERIAKMSALYPHYAG
jgi:hypothetical protein